MDVASPQREGSSGQAMVESAIVFPAALFVLLGLLQMGMIQQARLFADYAAYRGARTASLEMANCDAVVTSELAALTPMLGRSDSRDKWISTFRTSVGQQRGQRPVVVSFWDIDAPLPGKQSFDTQVTNEADVSHVALRMYFYYPLRIPFANWVISKWYLAQYGFARVPNETDALHPVTNHEDLPPTKSLSAEGAWVHSWTLDYQSKGIYVVPLYASWTMPMFSPVNPGDRVHNFRNACQ